VSQPPDDPRRLRLYLDELARRLPAGSDRGRILDEARDHLLEAIACEQHAGRPIDQAVELALHRFGSVEELAGLFAPRRRLWSALGADLVRLARRRRPVVQPRERVCSFCGKAQSQVKRLIAGPNDVQICSECVALCNQIIAEAENRPAPA
jgi:hypothetical protein